MPFPHNFHNANAGQSYQYNSKNVWKIRFFTYFSVSPHSDDKEKLHLQQVTTLRGDKKSCRIKENNKYNFYN